MVFFTCQHCNESLKKPSVEKHYVTKCRRNPYLTCIDCLKDFRGDEYVSHTSCFSEEQRYNGKNFVAKPVGVKQNNWMECVQGCISRNENPKYIPIFQSLSNYSNIPRKRQKFINFMSNAMRMKNTALTLEIFDLFEKEFSELKIKSNEGDKKKESIREDSKETMDDNENTDDNNVENKKKKAPTELSNEQTNGECLENSFCKNQSSEKKKKKKSKNRHANDISEEPLEEINNVSIVDSLGEESFSTSDHKKKKKSKKDKENEICEDQEANMNVVENVIQLEQVEVEKLSKKELKKLKKKQKYENELKQIEQEEKPDLNPEEDVEKEQDKSKKKKKRKATISESENDQTKKQKIEENGAEIPEDPAEECLQEHTEETKTRGKFDWEEVIKEVLSKTSDQEMSLKRLSKKVLSEYQVVKGDRETFEQLMSKFNKKINKIPGVRILKDKAKLIS